MPRDFVEFPSQVNEMWAWWPEILAGYAVHHRTVRAASRTSSRWCSAAG